MKLVRTEFWMESVATDAGQQRHSRINLRGGWTKRTLSHQAMKTVLPLRALLFMSQTALEAALTLQYEQADEKSVASLCKTFAFGGNVVLLFHKLVWRSRRQLISEITRNWLERITGATIDPTLLPESRKWF